MAIVLGGGAGSRLNPLTAVRAKPAVPFGGSYRVIDFVLSNLLHSHVTQVMLLTQYESESLHNHIRHGWYPRFGTSEDKFIEYYSPTQRKDQQDWYRGNADAVTHNLKRIKELDPRRIFVLGGDHIYLQDYRQQSEYHDERKAEMTVSAVKVPRAMAAEKYGVLTVDKDWRLIGFEEKPQEPAPIPDDPENCLASMGNYFFNTDVLLEELAHNGKKHFVPREIIKKDPKRYMPAEFSSYDFGYDILPAMLNENKREMFVYDISTNQNPAVITPGFWRDIGDIVEYYNTNMELLSAQPPIMLNHPRWRVRTYDDHLENSHARSKNNSISDSIITGGVVLEGAQIEHSILSSGLHVDGAQIVDSIVFGGKTRICKGARVRSAIIDKGVTIDPDVTIGHDQEQDQHMGLEVINGITIVPYGRTVSKAHR